MGEPPLRRDSLGNPTFKRNRVVPATAPRMASSQATDTEPRSAENSVRLEGLKKINRARRLKAATAPRSGQKMKHR
ncbi:MAG: hypothetical protein QOI07_629 [Verrucomicrobiota bacterium]